MSASHDAHPALTVAHIASPLQALNLVEYAAASGRPVDLVLIGDPASPSTVPQIHKVLAMLDTVQPEPPSVVERTHAGFWLKTGPQWQPMFVEMTGKIAEFMQATGKPVDKFVIGEWRAPALWQLAHALGLGGKDIVVIDDGNATLGIDRSPGSAWEQSLETQADREHGDLPPRGVTFFTSYAGHLKAAPDDIVIPNDYAVTRKSYSDLEVDPQLIVVVGQPLELGGVAESADLDLTCAVLADIERRHPDARILYATHRRESPERLAHIGKTCSGPRFEMRSFDLPFELVPRELGRVPGRYIAFYSSLMGNIAPMLPAGVELTTYRIPDERVPAKNKALINSIYAFFASHPTGRIEVRPFPPLADLHLFSSALLGTVARGARQVILAGAVARPYAKAASVSGASVTTLAAANLEAFTPASDTTVIVLGSDVAVTPALSLLERAAQAGTDVRVFAGAADAAWADALKKLGFRVFALLEEQRAWEEVTGSLDGRADALYGVRNNFSPVIVSVLHAAGVTGAERSHVELVESLTRQGAMVLSVFPGQDRGLGKALQSIGSAATGVQGFAWWMRPLQDPKRWTEYSYLHPQLIDLLRAKRPDAVLTESGVIPQGAIASLILNLPHVWYLREYGFDHGFSVPEEPREFGRIVRRLSTTILTNARGVRDHFFGDAEDARIRVVHPAPRVDIDAGASLPAAGSTEKGVFVFGVVGTILPSKGQEDAIRALAILRHEKLNVALRLFGTAQPDELKRLGAIAESLGVQKLISLEGVVSERAKVYGRLDAVAITSRSEAFGRVPFEAAAYERPVVYANAAGPSEYMEDGKTGLAYKPGDPQSLARALKRLVTDAGLRKRLTDAARQSLTGPERSATFDREIREAIAFAIEAASRDEY